jgi:NDP-sugar pyrophosphorylase family protein
MRAAILAGGRGTRLRPYTTVLPKPLVPIGEQPILELILHQLARCGFTRVDFLVGHLGELIRAYFDESQAKPKGMELRYFWEDEPLGTAGALHLIEPPEEPFLVMNGDILTTLDYGTLMEAHARSGAALTVATHSKDVRLELGVVEGDEGVISGYIEKPTLHYEVSMGIYAYSPEALEHVPREHFDFPDLVLALIGAGRPVARYHFDGLWFDIGTADEHERAVAAYESDPDVFERAPLDLPVESGEG